jgi:hypothetical protein
VKMWAGFGMNDETTATGLDVTVGEDVRAEHHEVRFEWLRRVSSRGGDHIGPKSEVGHELSIHDVPLEVVDTGSIEGFDFLAQTSEVARQNRRHDLNGKGHTRTLPEPTSSLGTK